MTIDIKRFIGISSIIMIGIIYKTIMYNDNEHNDRQLINIHNDIYLYSTLTMMMIIL